MEVDLPDEPQNGKYTSICRLSHTLCLYDELLLVSLFSYQSAKWFMFDDLP